jgi:hypothetical protein
MDTQSVKEILGSVVIAAVLVGGTLWAYSRERRRGSSILRTWAEENKFEVLFSEPRVLLRAGPFPYWKNPKQPVFFVRVRDEQGKQRSGWVRFGSFWGGTWDSHKADAKWQEDS